MLTLFSWPEMFGLPDNNPYGLKVHAFLKLCQVPFRQEHVMDASRAPHGQLPYIDDSGRIIGDSDVIIAHLIARDGLAIDAWLTPAQRDTGHLLRRMLDDLYWVMSYSRWQDDRFWPAFRDAFLRFHPTVTSEVLEAARAYNFKRYHAQGIGRLAADEAFARGIADLEVLSRLLPAQGFLFGPEPCSLDAALYGFLANILFFEIDTPLKRCLESRPNLVAHCRAMHARVTGG
jgi:glutathione S-transferase